MGGLGRLEGFTCPPEKPTAITPSSLPAERNLGGMVEGEVMMRAYNRVSSRMGAVFSNIKVNNCLAKQANEGYLETVIRYFENNGL